ncbi:MAG: dethiobiotin synthase [Mucilaginibacter sp.]|nr:dethiobiotin synthase [Mucilaginibacter sp.]
MPDKHPLFVTGIGTGIGKTLISAILVEKLKADYWKPIQSGDLDSSDTLTVQNLVSNTISVFHPEAYRLTQPYSPHKSAGIDGITIEPEKFSLPGTQNTLIIEGAGGLMVPLNDQFLMIDLIKQVDAEVILVSQNYLGSINHTLLSIDALKHRRIPIKGVIFNGPEDSSSETFILNHSQLKKLGHIPQLEKVNNTTIIKAGHYLTL